MWPEYTEFSSFKRHMRRELESDGFDPATPVQFRWDGPWTNARLMILTKQQSPKFKASVSNSVVKYIANFPLGVPMTISEP